VPPWRVAGQLNFTLLDDYLFKNWFLFGILVADSCEQGTETSGSIRGEKFVDQVSDYAPWSYRSCIIGL
jgi:hypothetical protein